MPTDDPAPPDPAVSETAFRLLDDYLRDLHAGRQPSSEQLLQNHPELAPLLNCLDALDQLSPRGISSPITDAEPTIAQDSAAVVTAAASNGAQLDFGNFELIGEIGRGGMGVIWKARQKDLDRVVAIKMILANHLASAPQVERFIAEAKIMARLHHPNIVRIHESGQVHGQHYFVMEYIAGASLASEVVRKGALAPEKAARLVGTVARAVAHLHAQGIVHRDLKPSNILLDEDGEPYVTDFGLVKMLGPGSQATLTGAILGTPAYMAPEQASGHTEQVGPLSDVYSLGAILYDLLTGRPPFQEDNPLDTLVQVIEGEPTRPCWVNPAIPAKLEMICLKCLEKAPEDRYASATAVADDLGRFLNGEDVEARPGGLWPSVRRWARRAPALVFRLCALVIFIVIVQVNYWFNKSVTLTLHVEVLALLSLWLAASVICQRALRQPRWAPHVPAIWSGVDALLLTVLLRITNSQNGPLLIGYPFLVGASGLWFQARLVWVTTAALEASYGLLVLDCRWRDAPAPLPHYHIIFMVALGVLGFVVAYQVQRIRVLSRYYEHRPMP